MDIYNIIYNINDIKTPKDAQSFLNWLFPSPSSIPQQILAEVKVELRAYRDAKVNETVQVLTKKK